MFFAFLAITPVLVNIFAPNPLESIVFLGSFCGSLGASRWSSGASSGSLWFSRGSFSASSGPIWASSVTFGASSRSSGAS